MESPFYIHIIPSEDPIPTQYSIPQESESPLGPCFRINLYFTHVEHSSNSEIPTTTTIFNETFFVPRDILCDCDPFEVFNPDSITMTFLHHTFISVPISSETLDSVLPVIGEHARQMVEHNYESLDMLEMDATVHLTTYIDDDDDEEEDSENQRASVAAILNSLEKVNDNDASSSCWGEECAICLEKLCNDGSESKLGRTKCLHVFHQDCIVRWVQHCNTSKSYSCPLCRCLITAAKNLFSGCSFFIVLVKPRINQELAHETKSN